MHAGKKQEKNGGAFGGFARRVLLIHLVLCKYPVILNPAVCRIFRALLFPEKGFTHMRVFWVFCHSRYRPATPGTAI